jgi:glycosyltransferase involved in cell wall biosynthesis
MNILYLGYWSAEEVLTQAVILPRLEILAAQEKVSSVIFCSIERDVNKGSLKFRSPKILHIGLSSEKRAHLLFTKLNDFTVLPGELKKIISQRKVGLMICNSPLAGMIGYFAAKRLNIPIVMECFEPHANYMVESGVWTRWDPRFLILRYYEKKLLKRSKWLLTVSENFKRKLLSEGIPEQKLIIMPNAVDLQKFAFNGEVRSRIRKNQNIDADAIVGIYVGKFGGIYYDDEAFDLFSAAAAFFGDRFRLILLSGDDHHDIRQQLSRVGLSSDSVSVLKVLHDAVPDYLSAADFAFATIKPAPSRIYCCPVKDGEYWANGLPVLLEEGIGDDSTIVRVEGGGIIFDQHNPQPGFAALAELIRAGRENVAQQIAPVAARHRAMALIEETYAHILAS